MEGIEKKVYVLRGQSRRYRFTAENDLGERIDLTGYTIEYQVKASLGAADPPLITKAVGSGIDLLNQEAESTRGQIVVRLLPADTDALAPGTFKHDCVAYKDGERHWILRPSDFVVQNVVNRL